LNNMNQDKLQQDVSHLVENTRDVDVLRLAKARKKALEQAQVDPSRFWRMGTAASVALFVAIGLSVIDVTETTNSHISYQVAEMTVFPEDSDDELYEDFYYWLDIYDQELIAVTN